MDPVSIKSAHCWIANTIWLCTLWIVCYTILLCWLLNWVHCWTVHTFEIGPLLNCAHCWTRNSDPVSLSSALNPSHTIMHERCMWDRSAMASWEWICTLGAGAKLTPFPSFRTRVTGRWTRPGLIGKFVSESMKRRKSCQAQFLQLGNNRVIVFWVWQPSLIQEARFKLRLRQKLCQLDSFINQDLYFTWCGSDSYKSLWINSCQFVCLSVLCMRKWHP